MNTELTKVEVELLGALPTEQREFFDKYFGKVSPRRWVTNLKHYNETYSIKEAIVICQANFS